MSFSFWIYPDDFDGNQHYISKKNPSSSPYAGWQIYINGNGALNFDYLADNATGIVFNTNSAVLTASTWQHVVVTYSNKVLYVYVDGVSVSVTKSYDDITGSANISNSLYFGSRNGSDRFFDGAMDDVRFWNRALTSDEVLELFEYVEENPSATSTATSTDMAKVEAYLGSLNFGLAILITIALIYFILMIWNNLTPKRKW